MLSSSIALSLVAILVLVLGVSAHGGPRIDWVAGLEDCWENCLQDTDNGCSSSKCICDASQDEDYLPPAVSCIARKCDADEWSIKFALLMPVAPYCSFAGNPIPKEILESAYAAVDATPEPTPTPTPTPSRKPDAPKPSSKHDQAELTKVYTTTVTETTTDKDGNTLLVLVPLVMGPSTISTGTPVTSTLDAKSSGSDSQTTASASPSPTPETPSSPESTQPQQPQSEPSSTPPPKAPSTNNNNGSPFENMQAGASQWGISSAVVCLGALTGIIMIIL